MEDHQRERLDLVIELEEQVYQTTTGTYEELAQLRSELYYTRRQLELSEAEKSQIAADLDLLAQAFEDKEAKLDRLRIESRAAMAHAQAELKAQFDNSTRMAESTQRHYRERCNRLSLQLEDQKDLVKQALKERRESERQLQSQIDGQVKAATRWHTRYLELQEFVGKFSQGEAVGTHSLETHEVVHLLQSVQLIAHDVSQLPNESQEIAGSCESPENVQQVHDLLRFDRAGVSFSSPGTDTHRDTQQCETVRFTVTDHLGDGLQGTEVASVSWGDGGGRESEGVLGMSRVGGSGMSPTLTSPVASGRTNTSFDTPMSPSTLVGSFESAYEVHMYVCMHACTYVHTYIHTCMYVCMYVCTYVCTYVCMHVPELNL
jgi:hypothetical protein